NKQFVAGMCRRRAAAGQLCVLAAILAISVHRINAEDTVYLRGNHADDRPTKVVGEVVDYTGREIKIRTTGVLEKAFPSARVLRIESSYTAAQQRADQAFA